MKVNNLAKILVVSFLGGTIPFIAFNSSTREKEPVKLSDRVIDGDQYHAKTVGLNGEELPVGSYYYIIEKAADGSIEPINGTITILRAP